jgi:ferric-dicitrate binding protein FerR (iron transport regulator)
MNEPLIDQSRVRDLIRRCLDGAATDAEAAELDGLVTRDPNVARELARAAQLEVALETVSRARPVARPFDIRAARRRKAIWVAVPVAALAAAALVLAWSRGEAPHTAAPVASRPAPPPAADVLARTAPSGLKPFSPERRVYFADGSFADLRDADTRLQTRVSTAAAVDIVLDQGGARFEVTKRPGRTFRVWVGTSYVEVVGTIFTVDWSAEGVRVSVERGIVNVVSGHRKTQLTAGHDDLVPLAHATPQPRRRASEPTTVTTRDEAADWLHASEAARRNGHPEQALALLRRLLERHANDPRAPYASFIMGRVLLEELRQPREAAAAFARVAVLDPNTPLAEDALAREVESWSRAGDKERAQVRAAIYLGRYPHGARADEVRRHSQRE